MDTVHAVAAVLIVLMVALAVREGWRLRRVKRISDKWDEEFFKD